MYLARVIGNLWATQKYETLEGSSFRIIQPINSDYQNTGSPIVAVDTIGAGTGEIVVYITASEAVIPLPVEMAPVDASIVAIVDSLYTKKNL
jgi:ethanolamine utilization protein EutN